MVADKQGLLSFVIFGSNSLSKPRNLQSLVSVVVVVVVVGQPRRLGIMEVLRHSWLRLLGRGGNGDADSTRGDIDGEDC